MHPFLHAVASLEDAPALAIVTNGEQSQQESKLAALGLDWVRLFTSSAMGVRKPDPELFLGVCDALAVRPNEAWFIGDNRAVDAVGAQDAGLHGIWLDREGRAGSASLPAPPPRTTTLANVIEWIRAAR